MFFHLGNNKKSNNKESNNYILSNPRLKIFNIRLGRSNFQKNWGQVHSIYLRVFWVRATRRGAVDGKRGQGRLRREARRLFIRKGQTGQSWTWVAEHRPGTPILLFKGHVSYCNCNEF